MAEKQKTSWGGHVKYILWSTGVAILMLALFEGGLRLTGIYGQTEVQPPAWMDGETYELWKKWTDSLGIDLSDVTDLEGWRWDPLLRWALKPNVEMTARNIFIDSARGDAAQWRLSTNSRGFRTPEFETSKDPGTLRVIVLGDSNSMGWLLDDEKTYPRRLEYYLGDLMERPVEVLNLAGGGYTSFSTLQLWRQEVLALNPDLLIVSCGANDGQRMQSTDEQYAAIFSGASGWLTYQLGRLKLTALLHRLRTERKAPPVPRVSPAKYGKNLALIAGEARDLGVPVVFFKVCCCRGAYQEELEKIVASFQMSLVVARKAIAANFSKPALRQSRAALIDEIFNWYTAGEREANPSLLFYFRDRCHMNPLGADLAAIGLAATVQKQLDKR